MSNNRTNWLKLKLRKGVKMKNAYIQVHTHLAIFSSCLDNGATIAFYQPDVYKRSLPGAVFYLQTDHNGFHKSCFKAYEKLFEITPMDEGFKLPDGYEITHGQDNLQMKSMSA